MAPVRPESRPDESAPVASAGAPATPDAQTAEVDDVLVEEVAIDGMCGVY